MDIEKPATFTVEEMQRYLKVGQNTAYKLIHREGFPVIWVSKRRAIIPVKALDKWLEENAGTVIE